MLCDHTILLVCQGCKFLLCFATEKEKLSRLQPDLRKLKEIRTRAGHARVRLTHLLAENQNFNTISKTDCMLKISKLY